MSTTSDYQYAKYSALDRVDASGEINLEGITFPEMARPRESLRLMRKIGRGLRAFFKALANAIKETPVEYNARMARRYRDEPPVRGLR